ncbi:MAG: hypothetical protein PVH88_00225 [Ignavibacteria bacterium]|jgi:hypothetical protein
MMTTRIVRTIAAIFFMYFLVERNIYGQNLQLESGNKVSTVEHVQTNDVDLINSAFFYGYDDNLATENVNGEELKTLHIQSVSSGVYVGDTEESFSIWVRDLYWGFLGWAQAGDGTVLDVMKSSISLLIHAKNKHQAVGQSGLWPLNDGRFYIPQCYSKGLNPSLMLWPWCSESQADFLLMAYNYWELSGDIEFIRSIWNDIVYVTETLELLDTNGNYLPDALQGSYDYTWMTRNTEEPLMCAKTSLAYSCVAKLARMFNKNSYADRLDKLALNIKETMNKDIEEGGLWKSNDAYGGYYVYMRRYTPDEVPAQEKASKDLSDCAWRTRNLTQVKDQFIPYENLVPMFCGMTDAKQNEAIFNNLDADFDKYYNLPYGPMYCAPTVHNEQSEADYSSVPWLAFLDVYLRGKNGHLKNRSKIFDLLMEHARDVLDIPFTEGMGIYGFLTKNAGRSWDNGNFFHMLVCGIYGIEKTKDGIILSAPGKIESAPLTELKNVRWRNAVYNFEWNGDGNEIKKVVVNGSEIKSEPNNVYKLIDKAGVHEVEISL